MYNVEILADTTHNNHRLTTIKAVFPRFILPEINTHRVFSRNSASSRARSFKATIREVMNAPYIPSPFTLDKPGMSGNDNDNSTSQEAWEKAWLRARNEAVRSVLTMVCGENVPQSENLENEETLNHWMNKMIGVRPHKQHLNRILEPYMWHTALITSDQWDNFFNLRIADNAQPEIRRIAKMMKTAMDNSTPLNAELHVPYSEGLDLSGNISDIMDELMVACARCARVSYKAWDGSDVTREKDEALSARLLSDKHLSPFEHVGFTGALTEQVRAYVGDDNNTDWRGNFAHWNQLRKVVEQI